MMCSMCHTSLSCRPECVYGFHIHWSTIYIFNISSCAVVFTNSFLRNHRIHVACNKHTVVDSNLKVLGLLLVFVLVTQPA